MRNDYLQMCDYGSRFRILKGGKISLVVSAFLVGTTLLHAAPIGGVVTSGSASIAHSGAVTNINQSSQKASINWQNFSIGSNETVNFNQPNVSAITLNRVVGNEKSVIDGAMNANGQVWLLNSNGLLFSKNASINTAGLVATTMNLSDEDFINENYHFKGESTASIINQGTITITDKGYAALFGKEVMNEGIIRATLGSVHASGASEVTLNLNGNSLVNLTVDKGVLDALVENKGAIYADGGKIFLTTNAVDELLKGVVNNSGVIEANSLDDVTGHVELFAHGGTANVSGSLDATGGLIETSGEVLHVSDTTNIKAKTWLLDPTNITIGFGGGESLSGTPATTSTAGDVTVSGATINTQLNAGTSVLLEATNDITVYDNIAKTAGDEATLSFKAHNDIVLAQGVSITSTVDKLNVVFCSNSDGSGEGRIKIGGIMVSTTITTNGGHLWMGGGTQSPTSWNGLSVGSGAAISSSSNGVYLWETAITTAGGNVLIQGTYTGTSDDARGVDMASSSISSGSGDIEIIGTTTQATGPNNGGISTNSPITSTTGAITLRSIRSTSSSGYGLLLHGAISSTSGNIALYTDNLTLNTTLTSSGTLTIAPSTPGVTIGIGGGTGTLSLASSYFTNNFSNSFSNIIIGSADTGDITIGGATTYKNNLTFKTKDSVSMNTSSSLTASASSDLTFWADSDANGGYIWLKATTLTDGAAINTNGGDLTLSGGADVSTGFAVGKSTVMSSGILIDSATLQTSGGDIVIRGKGDTGDGVIVSTSAGNSANTDGVRLMGSNTINSGTGAISIIGQAQGGSASNGIETSQNGITTITSAKTSGTAINLNGDASLGGTGSNGWGTFLWGGATSGTNFGIAISATGGGDILIEGKGRDTATGSAGVHVEPNAYVLANSGTITLKGDGGTNNSSSYGDVDISGTIGFASSLATGFGASPVTSSNANINIQADEVIAGAVFGGGALASSTAQSTGILSLFPYTNGNKLYVTTSNPNLVSTSWINPNNMFGSTGLFKTGFSKLVFGSASTGDVKLDNYAFDNDTDIISSGNAILGAIAIGNNKILTVDTSAGSGTITDSGNVDVDNLKLNGVNSAVTLDSAGNTISTLAANVNSLSLINNAAMTIGSVSGMNGVTATGTIDIATLTGDLTLNGNIASSLTASNAIVLNAGKNESAGTETGGNIIHSSGTISTGNGGRATLFTGSYDDSTGLVTLIGSGSGNFRYNADETTASYTPALSSGVYAIYREAQGTGMEDSTPALTSLSYTLSPITQSYNGTAYSLATFWSASSIFGASYSTWALGSDYVFIYNGNSATSFKNAGTYSNITIDVLKSGYTEASSGNTAGSLTINPKPLNPTLTAQDKIYDGTTNASISLSSNDIISGDSVSLSASGASFDSKHVGVDKLVSISGIALVGNDASNYQLLSSSASDRATITPRPLSLSALAHDKVYDGTTSALVTLSLNNAIAGDALSLNSGVAYFNDAHAGVNKVVSIEGVSVEGLDASNYSLGSSTTTATATITPRPLFVTADDATKYRYATDPLLSYHFTNNTSLIQGDSLSGALQREEGETLGTYAILQGSLANPDYALSFEEGLFTIMIDPASLINPQSIHAPQMLPNTIPQGTTLPLFTFTQNGQSYQVFSSPPQGVATRMVSLQELKELLQASGNGELRIPLLEGSLIYLVNGGVRLPEGVEQEFFIALL